MSHNTSTKVCVLAVVGFLFDNLVNSIDILIK